MPLDYNVEISPKKGIARFISRDKGFRLTYYLDLDKPDNIEDLLDKRWVYHLDLPRPRPKYNSGKIAKKKLRSREEQHYDKNENLVYFKSAEGQEQWYEYDERENLIHYKTSSGHEKYYVYDENDNLVNSWSNKDRILENCDE